MSTYQLHRNGKYWTVRWRNSNGRRMGKSLGPVTKREAEQLFQDMIATHAKTPGKRDMIGNTKLSTWLARYIEIREPELGKLTRKAHRLTCDRLFEFFSSDPNLVDITKHQASDWRLWLGAEKNLVESTVCKYVRAAKVIFNRAISEGVIVDSPVDHLNGTPPLKDQADRRKVTPDEFGRVVGVSERISTLLGLCYVAGLRLSEAMILKWDDLDLDRGLLVVRSTNGEITTKQRTREVRIEPVLRALLGMLKDAADDVPGWNTVAGVLEAGPRNPWRELASTCETAGVEPFTFKDLRAARDTIWHDRFPSHVVCAWMGHSEKVARDHYLSVPDEYYDGGGS